MVIDQQGKAFSWGSNTAAGLGTGDTLDSMVRYYPQPLITNNGVKAAKVITGSLEQGFATSSCGSNETFVLDDKQQLWGPGSKGSTTTLLASNVKDVKVEYGISLLKADGSVNVGCYTPTSSNNWSASLTSGEKIISTTAPFHLTNDDGTSVWFGSLMVISETGDVWQLTRNHKAVKLPVPTGVRFVKIGMASIGAVLTDFDKVLFRALDSTGRLWQWKEGDRYSETLPVPSLMNTGSTRFVNLSDSGVAAIDTNGAPWVFGIHDSNADKFMMSSGTIKKMPLPNGSKAVEIAGIQESNLIALDDQHRVWTRGYNYTYQLGDGTAVDRDSWGLVRSAGNFNNHENPDSGTTIACAPTTGIAPDGLTRYGLLAVSLLLVGLLVSAGLRRRLYR